MTSSRRKTSHKRSKPEVFIIESLDLEDEERDLLEGRRIQQMLALSEKHCRYFYIRSKPELERIMKEFRKSQYRYLHLSCHGDRNSLCTTFDNLSFDAIGKIINPYISQRRVFVSACRATSWSLASTLMTTTSCYSVMGPSCDIAFRDAALFWATFYHLMFKENNGAMKRDVIPRIGRSAAKLFKLRLKLFTREGKKIVRYVLR